MPVKEKATKNYICIGLIAFVFLLYLSLHISHAAYGTIRDTNQTPAVVFGSAMVERPVSSVSSINYMDALIKGLESAGTDPFNIFPISWKVIFPVIFLGLADAFFVGLGIAIAQTKRQSAPGAEHGRAKWNVNYKKYNKDFKQPYDVSKDPFDENMILSQKVFMNLNNRKMIRDAQRNKNVLIIGGPGTGKSFQEIKPNLGQMNCSCVTTDPSGELLRCWGKGLMNHGINVKLFSTSDMKHSNCYNPFDYVYDESGSVDEAKVSTMVFLFLKNASGAKEKSSGDPFWEKSAKAFLSALAYYLLEHPTMSKKDINFTTVLRLTQSGKVNEGSSSSQSALDLLMEEHRGRMKELHKESKALSNYDTFKLAPAKTANSILITCAVDLQLFNNEDVKNLCRHDYEDENNNVHLDRLGDEQTALFINIPQANGTFNFLVSMLYSQLFDALYTRAEKVCPYRYYLVNKQGLPVITMLNSKEDAEKMLERIKTARVSEYKTKKGALHYQVKNGKTVLCQRPTRESAQKVIDKANEYEIKKGSGRLPWHVRCLMDEFANIGEVPEFSEKLSTMRKYEISCTIVVQNLAQIKARYDKLYESIIGGCDTIVFLGSSENETCEYISKSLGETTIRVRNTSRSYKGGGSESYSASKRMLMTPNEVKTLSNDKCIVMIRGIDPFMDDKYNFTKHPNYKFCGDADQGNEMDEGFMNTYFSSAPYKPKPPSKKTQQIAASKELGRTKYVKGEDFKVILSAEGVSEEEIVRKVTPQDSTYQNEKNKEIFVNGGNPVSDAASLKEKEKKYFEKETRSILADDLDEDGSMSDSIFLF